MASPLVQAKVTAPALDEVLLARPRLEVDIAHLLERHPVLVVAGVAGAGKTVAVAQAVRSLERPVAWVRLDESDQAAGRLVLYLEAAIAARHPASAGRASAALRVGAPPDEAAALLAEELVGSGLVVVCDDVERVAPSPPAKAVLSSLARYLPSGTNLVLVSRRPVALTPAATRELGRTAVLDADSLHFRRPEAVAALRRRGRLAVDIEVHIDETLRDTGGWVTGVLYSGRTHPAPEGLSSYLYDQVWSDLTDDEQDLLLRCAVLEDVTVSDAAELGAPEPGAAMTQLRRRHLPLSWDRPATRLTLHPLFREFVLDLLAGRDAIWRGEVRRRHIALLLTRGRAEDAVEALIEAGEHAQAWQHAIGVLPHVVERMDLAQAARWLDALAPAAAVADRPLTSATSTVVLRVAFGLEQYRRGAAVWDRDGPAWAHDLVATETPEPVVLLVWCLWHLGRLADARRAAAALPQRSWHRQVAETVLALSADDPPPFPDLDDSPAGPLESLLLRVAYTRGRLRLLHDHRTPGGPWREVQSAAWRIAALWAAGRGDEALAEWELRKGTIQPLWLDALDAVELLLDAGQLDQAWAALSRGRERARAAGSTIYTALLLVYETRARLRVGDLAGARQSLARAATQGADDHAFTRDLAALCHGVLLLHEGRAAAAERTLARCVQDMRCGDRWLELPAAACYLSEAQARRGGTDAMQEATATATFAMRVARERGSEGLLRRALADVPEVLDRAARAHIPEARWWQAHLDRAGDAVTAAPRPATPRIVLEDFGAPELRVDGRAVKLRGRKELELLAYLLSRTHRAARRRQILDALFSGREDRNTASYLRQCLHRLRGVLPDGVELERDGQLLRLVPAEATAATSGQVLADLRRADGHRGDTHRALLAEALRGADRGDFLAGVSGPWIDERRREVHDLIEERRLQLAQLAVDAGDLDLAQSQVERVLTDNPFREQAWRTRLIVDGAAEQHDRLLQHYRAYREVMRELDMAPSAEMHRLVESFRGHPPTSQ